MNRTIAFMAHVDAGKTTLSEAVLYACGSLRKAGRVDLGTTALDTDPIERARGITVYDSQADFCYNNHEYTLIDTPGHTDFAGEALRVLPVLDGAVLLLDATGKPDAHFTAIYRQLMKHSIPTLLVLTKCDRPAFDADTVLRLAQARLGIQIIPVSPQLVDRCDNDLIEKLCDADDLLTEIYLEGNCTSGDIWSAIERIYVERKALFCVSVSGMTGEGLQDMLTVIDRLLQSLPVKNGELYARFFQVRIDSHGQKVCFARVLGGTLLPRMEIEDGEEKSKINELRSYTGSKYRIVDQAESGQVVGITGLSAHVGDALRRDGSAIRLVNESGNNPFCAALRSFIRPENPEDFPALFASLRMMTQEDPLLDAAAQGTKGVNVSIAGPVQLEVLCQTLLNRFGLNVHPDPPHILYRETVAAPIRGCGHYEPLRHYAEVQLALIPQPAGSGLSFQSLVPVDDLSLNWQRLIETHVLEKSHPGYLTGAPLTDVRIILLAGRAHLKHTEGGDFRQATYRAIRQALFHAENILLEPWVSFEITLPAQFTGRAIADIQRLSGETTGQDTLPDGSVVIRGSGPLKTLMDYPLTIAQYTHGEGVMSTQSIPSRPCHDTDAVVAEASYDAGSDTENPAWSVFCAHGAGYAVPWDQVPDAVHTSVPQERLIKAGLPC